MTRRYNSQTESDPQEFRKLIAEAEQICNEANFKLEDGENDQGEPFAIIYIPNGRKTWPIKFQIIEHLQFFLKTAFTKQVILGSYLAIASYQDALIEAAIRCEGPSDPYPRPSILQAFGCEVETDYFKGKLSKNNISAIKLSSPNSVQDKFIEIGPISDELLAISGEPSRDLFFSFGYFKPYSLILQPPSHSLKIKGFEISNHDDALDLLERIAASLFFQIDMSGNCANLVQIEPLPRNQWRSKQFQSSSTRALTPIEFPVREYDDIPISLYMYARSCFGRPLLVFLSFYQCLEFYFPTYSEIETRRQVQQVLKDPTFRVDRDSDLARLIACVKPRSQRLKGFGNECQMLRDTLRCCVNPDELRKFLQSSEDRVKYFSNKSKKARRVTDRQISIEQGEEDLLNSVADWIYDVRCKIVHTDNSGETIMPISKEEKLLTKDNELLQFLAQKVLIAGSSNFKI